MHGLVVLFEFGALDGFVAGALIKDCRQAVETKTLRATWRPGQLPIGQTAKARSGCRVQSLPEGHGRQALVSLR
jgi:hypothetical protein